MQKMILKLGKLLKHRRAAAIVIVLGLIFILALAYTYSAKSNSVSVLKTNQKNGTVTTVKACDLYKPEEAKKKIGQDAKQVSTNTDDGIGKYKEGVEAQAPVPAPQRDPTTPADQTFDPKSTNDPAGTKVAVTTCDYIIKDKDVSLIVRSSDSNQSKKDFTAARPNNAKDLNGYGDSAYESMVDAASGKKQYVFQALKSQYVIIISGDANDSDMLRDIAKTAVRRIN